MLRFARADEPGWTGLRRDAQAHALHALVNTHVEGLPAMLLPDAPGASAVRAVHTRSARCVFRVLKEPPGAPDAPSVDIFESRWDLWCAGSVCVWQHSRGDEGRQLFVQRCAAAAAAAAALGAARVYDPAALQRVARPADVAQHTTPAHYCGFFAEAVVLVRVPDAVRRVLFLADHFLHQLHAFGPPRCVNACYTAVVGGLVRATGHTTTINARDERGPCGSEFYISSVLGVLHIFPCQQGARRVTCKAFACAADAALALDAACSELGLVAVAAPLVHMIIMKGTTGCGLDIAQDGNLAHVLRRSFGAAVAYVPRLDEVNVHGTCSWPRLWDVCAGCPAGLQARAAAHRAVLLRTKLDVRVTRLGTCIYSVTVPKPAAPAELDSAAVEQCLFALCEHVHAIIGGGGSARARYCCE